MAIKNLIRKSLNLLHLDLTQNLKYDRLTKEVISKCLNKNSLCVDVGCHKGEILDLFLQFAPEAMHYAFEPIPSFFEKLKVKYGSICHLFDCALSDQEGSTNFHFVRNAPAYSGIKKRDYATANPDIEEIEVSLKTLDSIIPENTKVDFIKIDVEGAEFGVLKGAKRIINQSKPIVLFEFGMGAGNHYGTSPADIFHFFAEAKMQLFLLEDFLNNKQALTEADFTRMYENSEEYYFVAGPKIQLTT